MYSLVGFEVTPATVIGLLTILGFSLYDTVIVFDKVEENTHGFQHTTRRTFAEQANLAINQTFMRSINTSLISVLPILALMVVAVWLLGVGHAEGPRAGAVGRHHGRHLLVDLLRHAAAGHAARADRDGAQPHPPRDAAPQARPRAAAETATGDESAPTTADERTTVGAPRPTPAKPAPTSRPRAPGRCAPPVTRRPTGKRNVGRR